MMQARMVRFVLALTLSWASGSCSTLPTLNEKQFSFPKEEAFMGNVTRPYEVLGLVRSQVNFPSLDVAHDESDLCKNYFNKSVKELVQLAISKGGQGVIDVKSVV